MFDKKLYAKNRKAGKRGQGEIDVKIIPKGETPKYIDRNGVEKELANALGQHRAFSSRGGIIALNRKEYRRRTKDRTYTSPNYKTRMEQKDSNGKKINSPHKVNKPDFAPTYAPNLTNNQRMKLREIRRIELRESKLQTV